jgi:hypothetical protein
MAPFLGAILALPAVARADGVDPITATGRTALVARVVVPSVVRTGIGTGRILDNLKPTWADGGGPVQLLVLDERHDGSGRSTFLRVLLPRRPNATSGWIDANQVKLRTTPWRLEVSTAERTLTVLEAGVVKRRMSVVVGRARTPTPLGLTAILDRTRAAPDGFLGSWILRLAIHSDVIRTELGHGQVAIHGRGGTSLRTPLGTAGSHGCIRLANSDIEWLARIAQPGTPVLIS